MTRRRIALIAVLALAGWSCGEPGPVAGELTFNLTTPNTDDGAVQIAVSTVAPNMLTSVAAACGGCKAFTAKVSDTQYRAVITGTIGAGAVVRVGVSDVGPRTSYSGQVVAVASRTFVVRSAAAYTLVLAP